MAFPPFTDLTALIGRLARSGKDGDLRKALLSVWRAQSCVGDLRQAIETHAILTKVTKRPREPDSSEWITIERALLSTAISLYARATGTSSRQGDRGAITLERGKLTADQWKDHQTLLDVRNQALAHVYSDRTLGDHEWHETLMFAVEDDDGSWKPAAFSRQTGYHRATAERLGRLLPVAHAIVTEAFQRRLTKVTNAINESSVPRDLFAQCQFDPIEKFGNEEAVRAVLAGRGKGTASFWYNE